MKRFVFIIGALLLSLALRAQEATYTCRYWFDQNHVQAVTTIFGESGWEAELEVGQLTEGLHVLNLHVLVENAESRFGMEGDSLYRLADTTLMKWSAPQTYLFLKTDQWEEGNLNYVYHCWFDQDFEHQVSDSLRDGHILLDVADLEEGLHTVHVMLEGGALTAAQSYMFMKMPVEDPSMALQYHCWFDQDYANVQTGLVGSGLVELEVSDLPNGIHTVNVQLDNGTLTAPQTYLFYKQPLGGYGIARWEYWLNDDFDNRNTTLLSPTIDSLSIVSLLPVGHPDIRSSCFHFHPNGDNPYINAKNQITFRVWDSEMRFFDKTAMFVDEQVQQDIVAQVFEHNTTETFAAPRNNQIQWFKLDAVVGDSLSFVASKACTMQLFAPSGEEVFNVSGPESITLRGLHAWEDGTYYLAVHDMTGSGETVSVTYNWVYRYAILAYDVHLVGNGGCSTITFNGNGYNSLLDVYLVNAQNDTIRRLDIGHESNSTTTVTFNFYGVNLGVYDAVFEFYDETMVVNNALEVQEPVDIVLTSTVSYPATFRRDTECTYTFTITNNGNMTAYSVPLYVYVSSPTPNGISYVSIDGLELKSFYELLYPIDEWTNEEIELLKEYSDIIGDNHHFIGHKGTDEITGDSVFIRTGYFYPNVPPNTTVTYTFSLTGSEAIETWISTPDTWFSYIQNDSTNLNKGFGDFYCCHHQAFEDAMNVLSWGASGIALVSAVVAAAIPPTAPVTGTAAIAAGVTSCVSGALSYASSELSKRFCTQESLPQKPNIPSGIATAVGCAFSYGKGAGFAAAGFAATNVGLALSDDNPSKNYYCSPKEPQGGKSIPVQPCEPNEIRGYVAESGSHYMMQEIQTITYEIESENDTTATAAAHTIIVRDTLDVNKFDVASLAAYRVTIHDKVLELNGEHNFVYTLDLRPNVYVIAQIQLECDDETGIVVWTITSLDPMTMEPTTDPNQGALPINYNGEGIATFTFNVNLKEPFPDGTEISNRVGIIFDLEEPVITDTWTNTVDAVKPTSHIEEVTPVVDSLSFSFVSEDNSSGVWYHTLYYRNDSTDMQWQVKVPRIFENSCMLRFDEYQTTEYLVMAVDSAGNVEEKDMVAEYIHYYDGPVPITQCEDLLKGWNWFAPMVSTTIDDIENALNEYHENILSEHERVSSSIEPGEMLKIQTNANCTLSLTGIPFTTATVEITQGTNWIGCIGTEKAVGEVFNADFGPAEGDKIISQDGGFAIFNGVEWKGTLETLQPGHGYVYYSNANEPKTLLMEQ